jgi:hypothetical protein
MNNLIAGLLGPKLNKFLVVGFILLVLGFLLIPILIGIPIFMLGVLLFVFGVFISMLSIFPGGKNLVSEYEKMFSRMFSFLKALVKEVR